MVPTSPGFHPSFIVSLLLISSLAATLQAEEIQGKGQVIASRFGFDAEDATEGLQKAIDSGAARVVVDKQATPWIVSKTIRLKSDQEIVFEDGVVVMAKKGAFLGKADSLFLARDVANLTLRGKATLQMRKEDYWKPPYEKAEWRHALSLRGCTNVQVLGLTFKESGGDGIYLGIGQKGSTNKDILIKNVVCDANNRQGISVITAENLLIESTILKNTRGTPPAAGIDFEPNRPTEKLVNCVMRNCLSQGNANAGYAFYLRFMDETSEPVSVRIENCVSKQNGGPSVALGMFTQHHGGCLEGKIEFVDCRFEEDKGRAVIIRDNAVDGVKLVFKNCLIRNVGLGGDAAKDAPLLIRSESLAARGSGNVVLENVTVVEPVDRKVLEFGSISPIASLAKVTGTLIHKGPDKTETFVLNEELLDAWFPMRKFTRVVTTRDWKWTKPATETSPGQPAPFPRLRGPFRLAAHAEKGAEVSILVALQKIGRGQIGSVATSAMGPSGKRVETRKQPMPDGRVRITFTAEEAGVYTIDCKPESGGFSSRVVRATVPVSIAAGGEAIRMIYPRTTLCFVVPGNTENFAVGIAGSGAERVKATLLDAEGRTVETRDNISTPTPLIVQRETPSREDEIWRLQLERPSSGVLEDVSVALTGVPPMLAPSPEMLLRPTKP